jgi:cob(I)alamin adenosyltransferase
MVAALEERIDDLIDRFDMPTDFVVPGANRVSAALDLARTVVRRAERLLVSAPIEDSLVGHYLNRLSDLLWAMARWVEGEEHLLARGAPRRRARGKARRGTAGSEPSDDAGPSPVPDGDGDGGAAS